MSDPTDKLLLDAVYGWEKNFPNQIYLTQPLGDGEVVDYTWGKQWFRRAGKRKPDYVGIAN